MLNLYLLGRPHITLDNEPVEDLVSTKALTLLAYLACEPGPHPRETLAGLLWGETSEKRARASLRTALYNLQQRLPGSFEASRTVVAFSRDRPYFLDVVAFETALNAADDTSNIEHLEAAVELYRGDFLEGTAVTGSAEIEAWVRDHRERLRLLLLRALEQLADHDATRGRWEAAIETTRRILAVEPWRASAHRQLMRLLARTGRHSAALAQYETCREILAEELGVDPMPETTYLYRRIQRIRARPRQDNLPPQPTEFVGREEELDLLRTMLADPAHRLITLVGPGGIGKTRLALEAAARYGGPFLDGVVFVPLADLDNERELVSALSAALGLPPEASTSPQAQLFDYLRRREMLLVLDSFEHLLDEAQLIVEILEAAPEVNVLITSRVRLNVRWETLMPLKGLTYVLNGAGGDLTG